MNPEPLEATERQRPFACPACGHKMQTIPLQRFEVDERVRCALCFVVFVPLPAKSNEKVSHEAGGKEHQ